MGHWGVEAFALRHLSAGLHSGCGWELPTPHPHVFLPGQPLAAGYCLYVQHGASDSSTSAGTSVGHALSCLSYLDILSPLPGSLGVLPAHSHGLWPLRSHLPATALPSPHGPKDPDRTAFNLLPACFDQCTHPHHPCSSTQVLWTLPYHPLLLWPPSTAQTLLLHHVGQWTCPVLLQFSGGSCTLCPGCDLLYTCCRCGFQDSLCWGPKKSLFYPWRSHHHGLYFLHHFSPPLHPSQLCTLWLERPGSFCAVCGPRSHAQPHRLRHMRNKATLLQCSWHIPDALGVNPTT